MCHAEQSRIEALWNPQQITVPWEEVIQTEEVRPGQEWQSYTTDFKFQLAELHDSWAIPRESVRHYMSMQPRLTHGLESALVPWINRNHSYNLLKLTPGHMLVWHFDTFATFVRRNQIPEDQWQNIKRSIVMLTNWNFGQILQIGGDVLHDWVPGTVYTWDSDVWHGVSNFGGSDIIVMQISYI